MLLFPGISGLSAFSVIVVEDRDISTPVSESDRDGIVGHEQRDSVDVGQSEQEVFDLTNNMNSEVTSTVKLDSSVNWKSVSKGVQTLSPGETTVYKVDTTNVDSLTNSGDYIIENDEGSFLVTIERTIQFSDVVEDLKIEPPRADTSSLHTWEYEGNLQFNGEIDTVTVDYPTGTSLNGLTEENVTVTMTRNTASGSDTSQISVNSDSYSGSTATFDLSGAFNTNYAGFIQIKIDGVENPSPGSYDADMTFDGNQTVIKSADFQVQKAPIFISSIDTPETQETQETNSFTVNYQDADSTTNVKFEYFLDGTKVNQNTLSGGKGSDSVSDSYAWSNDGTGKIIATASDNNDTDQRTNTIDVIEPLTTDPSNAGVKSLHTWEYKGNLQFNGEIDTVTVDYPTGTSLNGLTEENVTVTMTRNTAGGSDTSQISVNSDSYSGSTATFDLSGAFNTNYAGFIQIKIDGVKNPSSGSYNADITFNGNEVVTKTESFTVSP